MNLLVLNRNLEAVALIDQYKSLIWTERYSEYGDFEILTPVSDTNIAIFQDDYYLWSSESAHTMFIERREIQSDNEGGDKLLVTGRSLESMLQRRIIWAQTILTGKLQDGVKRLLDENIISPADEKRKIDNFVFVESTDPAITELTLEAQYYGDNLYAAIKALCDTNNIGFKIILTNDGVFEFSLYAGADRSYDQLDNPYVVFSPKFENIISSNYLESKMNLKTVALVAGEGSDDSSRTTVTVEIDDGGGSGLDRREMFTDARQLSSTTGGGTIKTNEYSAQLTQKGEEDLAENDYTKSFEGQVETTQIFKYREDFFMGDIVQYANEYGNESKSRLTEFVRSYSETGVEMYPTFTAVE